MVDFKDTKVAFERKTDRELRNTAWLFKMMNSSFLVDTGSSLTMLALKMKLPVKGAIKQTIFKQFCGGTTFEECKQAINELAKYEVATVLDYGAEGKETKAAFDVTVNELTKAVAFASHHSTVHVITCKVTGLCKNKVLESVTTALNQGKEIPVDSKREFEEAINLLDKIAQAAFENNMALYIDAEESWIQTAIDEATDIMMSRYNKEKVTVYNTFQMYRHDRLDFLKKSFEKAKEGQYILGAKLVRGAYMEKERERAKEKGYPSPIQPDKEACDRDYNAAVKFCVDNHTQIASCVASHNEYSNQYQVELMEEQNIPKDHPHLNFCQLYGMSDNLTFNLANEGYNSGKYTPYGPVEDVIPYLIRRARENSSVNGEMSRELSLIQEELKRRK